MSTSTSHPLHPEHAETLARLRIQSDMLEAAGVVSLTDTEVRETLGLKGYRGADLSGIFFPYLSPVTRQRVGGRIRLDNPLPDGGKYISEPGCRHLFFATFPKEWVADTSIPVMFVESEKAALALLASAKRAQKKLIVVALGGCWGWRRKIGNRPLPDGGSEPEMGPSQDLDLITWKGRQVLLAFDSNARSNAGVRKARRAFAHELAGRGAGVLIAEVPAVEGVNGPDDLIAVSGDDALFGVLDNARMFAECAVAEAGQEIAALEDNQEGDPLSAIEAIAAVDDAVRRDLLVGRLVAARLKGVSRKFIDQQVRQTRAQATAARAAVIEAVRRSRLLALGETMSGAEMLDSICLFVQRFVLLSRAQLVVVALWVTHTYAFFVAECTPYLSITSPEKRSGKTRLLEVLATLVLNPWHTGRVTAAVLYRKIDAESPTLLLDESDAAFRSGEEYGEALRGILNSGHRRGGKATCCLRQGVDTSYKDFSTFSPKAIAGIGELPDTVRDRSVPIRLKRKTQADKVERFRLRNVRPEAELLREQLEAWCGANIERLRDARPELPEALTDRQQDGAEPALAIADLAGGAWPQRARDALIALCAETQGADDSIGARLLDDVYEIFHARGVDKMTSIELARALAEIETSPWGEWNQSKPITPLKLACLLRPFDVIPHNIRISDKILRGYKVGDFEDSWKRYGRASRSSDGASRCDEAATPPQANTDGGSSESSKRYKDGDVAVPRCEKPNKNAICSSVAAAVSPGEANKSLVVEEW